MTGDESLQFVEYLRHNNHLVKTAGNGEFAEQGGSERPQGRLWELTDLSASEFADGGAILRARPGRVHGHAVRHGIERIIFPRFLRK